MDTLNSQREEAGSLYLEKGDSTKRSEAASAAGKAGADAQVSQPPAFLPGGKPLKYLKGNEFAEKALQWNLEGMIVKDFKTNRRYDVRDPSQQLQSIVTDPDISSILKLGPVERLSSAAIKFKQLSLGVTSMTFFDRLESSGIVSSSGYIKKCMDEQHGDMIVSDLLREMLLNEDSERADLYNDEEQNEFIFHIFKILVMGGSLCQPDDNINVYLDATKQIYKDLVSVHRSTKTDKLQISTRVFIVPGAQDGFTLYPDDDSGRSFLYFLLDERKRLVTCWHRKHSSYW